MKKLENDLFDKVGDGMKLYGYEPSRKDQHYVKTTSVGRLNFHLSFIRHQTDFDVTGDVAVRFDRLEELLYEDDPERAESSYSLGAELGNIMEFRQKRWTISTIDDIDNVSQSILEAFATIGMPYLEKYSDMENALAALGGDDRLA